MTSDEYRDLTRDFFKKTSDMKPGPGKYLREQLAPAAPVSGDVKPFSDSLRIIDVDNDERVDVVITTDYDMVTLRFGSSMSINLNARDAQALAAVLHNASIALDNDY